MLFVNSPSGLLQKKSDSLWFWLLVLITILFWIPARDVHPSLSPGDMGRDLYAFWRTSQGEWPCRDFWWQYGPAMPLYYTLWFLIGGVNLVSVRMGLGAIYLLTSLLGYRALRLLVSPPVAFLASLALLNLDITWTFNHIGAFPFLFLTLWGLWKFFLTREVYWCYGGLAALGGMALVKINVGLTSLFAFLVSLALYNQTVILRPKAEASQVGVLPLPSGPTARKGCLLAWRHFIFLPLLFSVIVFLGYAPLLWGLPLEWVNQCAITFRQSVLERSWNYSQVDNLKHLIQWFFVWDRGRLAGVGALGMLWVFAVWGLAKRKAASAEKRIFLLAGASTLLFGLANSLDYFADGLIYRVDFWFFPMAALLTGLGVEAASFLLTPQIKRPAAGLLIFILLWIPSWRLRESLALRSPDRYLDLPQGKAYLGGPPSYPAVLNRASRFLLERTRSDQEILALPYDPIYGFLAGRRHAVRELNFAEHMLISETREDALMGEIEAKQIPFVLLSNRYRTPEKGMGHFGKTHLRRLAAYLFEHYREVETFGPWDSDPGRFHAVKIFQRK